MPSPNFESVQKADICSFSLPVPIDSAQNARSVREDTAELASYLLSDRRTSGNPPFLNRSRPSIFDLPGTSDSQNDQDDNDPARDTDVIPEVSEPSTPDASGRGSVEDGPSALANLLRKSPPESAVAETVGARGSRVEQDGYEETDAEPQQEPTRASDVDESEEPMTERTPLLRRDSSGGESPGEDLEGQKRESRKKLLTQIAEMAHQIGQKASSTFATAAHPKQWNYKSIWETVIVEPAACLPAVCVGLLLNILDALSYGMHPWRSGAD